MALIKKRLAEIFPFMLTNTLLKGHVPTASLLITEDSDALYITCHSLLEELHLR